MVLLIEDEEDDAFIMKRALMKVQNAPLMTRVSNGRDAVDYLKGIGKFADRSQYPLPRLIFLDLKLPYVHGFEVLNWIKGQPAFSEIHVTILTSSLEELDRERAVRLGANGFYVKPPKPETLAEIFRSIPALKFS
jgi:CheY-like chemotaxis protein